MELKAATRDRRLVKKVRTVKRSSRTRRRMISNTKPMKRLIRKREESEAAIFDDY